MSALAASGPIGGFYNDVMLSLCRCASFQEWAGVTDSTAALDFIHLYKTKEPVSKQGNPDLAATLEPYRPGYWFENMGSGGVGPFGGSLVISFQSLTSEEYADDEKSAFVEHINKSGMVMVELIAQMKDSGHPISKFIEIIPAQPNEKKDTGRPTQQSWWRVDWGCPRVNVS